MTDAALALAAWLATYAVHSTILIAVAWLAARALRDRPHLTSSLWKVAAIGGIVTASVASAFALDPIGGRVELATAQVERVAPVRVVHVVDDGGVLPEATRDATAVSSVAPVPMLPLVLVATWLLGVALASVSLVVAHARLRAVLRSRRPAPAALSRMLAGLAARVPGRRMPALFESAVVVVPFATGVLHPRIIVPARAATSLSPTAQRTMLAHELAHVLRRDPAWRLVLVALERVFFFQPLLRLARRGLEHDAEYLCDAWAASHTDAPLELARCLTEIASWVRRGPQLALAATMAGPRSILHRRVLRLVEGGRTTGTVPRAVPAASVIACAVLPFVAPVIAGASAGTGASPQVVIRIIDDVRHVAPVAVAPPSIAAPVIVAAAPLPVAREPVAREPVAREPVPRRTDRQPRRARPLAAAPPAAELRVVYVRDDVVAVVDGEAVVVTDDIAAELDAIIAESQALAGAARARGKRATRALERRARALGDRAQAHRESIRALRERIRVLHDSAPMLAPVPAPPLPPVPPRPPAPPAWAPDIVPAALPLAPTAP